MNDNYTDVTQLPAPVLDVLHAADHYITLRDELASRRKDPIVHGSEEGLDLNAAVKRLRSQSNIR